MPVQEDICLAYHASHQQVDRHVDSIQKEGVAEALRERRV